MSQSEKAKQKLLNSPKNYTYSDAKSLLKKLGFQEYQKGKTSGSRIKFFRATDQMIILLHKPHLGDQMNVGAINALRNELQRSGDL